MILFIHQYDNSYLTIPSFPEEDGLTITITAHLDFKPLSLDIGQSCDPFSFTLEDLKRRIKYLRGFITSTD